MKRGQTSVPSQWLIADERLGGSLWRAIRTLPRGSGVLVLYRQLRKRERARLLARLRRAAVRRDLLVVDEVAGDAARIHDLTELRRAGSAAAALLFVSPMFDTRTHPGLTPIAPMRAAAMVRLAKAPVIALGGMDERRFRRIQRLGFSGWAGIDAWIRT